MNSVSDSLNLRRHVTGCERSFLTQSHRSLHLKALPCQWPVVWPPPSDSWINMPWAYFLADSFSHSQENESFVTASQSKQKVFITLAHPCSSRGSKRRIHSSGRQPYVKSKLLCTILVLNPYEAIILGKI